MAKKMVIWVCGRCGHKNRVDYATGRKKLTCSNCGGVHVVTGHHINGTPFVRYLAMTSKLDQKRTPVPKPGRYFRPNV